MSFALLWITGAALVSGALTAWLYLRREERVPGRTLPAALRGVALFLVMAGPALPTLRQPAGSRPDAVVLLDISRSMALPVEAEAVRSRLDSARALLATLAPERVILFGEVPQAVGLTGALAAPATASRSRVVPALQAAGLSGADSVWILTDGDWSDRGLVLEAAGRLGMGIRELRVATPEFRLGLVAVEAPERLRAGDTAVVSVELTAGGTPGGVGRGMRGDTGRPGSDSVTVALREGETMLARVRVPVPASGRGGKVRLSFVPQRSPADQEVGGSAKAGNSGEAWRVYEVALSAGADPLAASDRLRFTMEVMAEPGEAVLVSLDPDWEPPFLLPVLERAVLEGARGFLRVGENRWLEMGTRPHRVDRQTVVRAVASAPLLVVQGQLDALPGWLETATAAHRRRLLFPRAAGTVPGTSISLTQPLPGEWYPAQPPAGGAGRKPEVGGAPTLAGGSPRSGSADHRPGFDGRRDLVATLGDERQPCRTGSMGRSHVAFRPAYLHGRR